MRTSILGAAAFVLGAAFAGNAGAQTVVSTDVTVDTTWSGTVVLQQPIFVKNGATLTIEPGTIVRGQPRTAAVLAGSTVGTPGTLIVTNVGTIIANGTPESPIIMTTAAVDNDANGVPDDVDSNGFLDEWVPGGTFLDNTPTTAPLAPLAANGRANVALWGGLVVLGNATTNLGNNAGLGQGLNTVEGLTVPGFPVADATYGGSVGVGDDADSSGSLSYISVRHAGDEIGNSNELNGVTLAGVGTGTEFHHVEVYCNFDDGIEWFGGTVNGHHLEVVFAGDDVFDADEGYRGTNQFLVGIMPFFNASFPTATTVYGSAGGDKGCEFDGDNSDTVPQNVNTDLAGQPTPFQNGNFYNLTISGSRPSASFNGHTNDNDGCEMRNGFAGSIQNGLIFNTGGTGTGAAGGRQGLDLAGGGLVGFTDANNATAGLLLASAISCDNVAPSPAASPEITAFGNGVRNVACVTGVNDPGFRMNARDTAFTPTGVAGKLDASLKTIDLRISLPNATMADGIVPPSPLENATYRGAYDAVSAQWTDGWTALSMAGMQPVPEPGMVQLIGAGAMGLLALSRRRR